MLSQKRVLVVEAEFLVALDLQRVLEDADAAKTVFARSIEEAANLVDRFHEFDLAIVEAHAEGRASTDLVRAMIAGGVAVVGTSTDASYAWPSSDLAEVPLVRKPFDETELVRACVQALAAGSAPR